MYHTWKPAIKSIIIIIIITIIIIIIVIIIIINFFGYNKIEMKK